MGLKSNDLQDLVYNVLEIDSFKSKMGNDNDIITLAFSVQDEEPANDLMNFLEKGYDFVLDADRSPGEQSDGTYKVFVEMERGRHAPEQIMELVDGVKKLSGLDNLRFRYYKNFKSQELTQESLTSVLPIDRDSYDAIVNERRAENYTEFFDRSLIDSIVMTENKLTFKKIYADPIQFEFVDFGSHYEIFNNLNEGMNVNDFAEIIFLTKYIGDYNISKYGDKVIIENNGNALVLKRVV